MVMESREMDGIPGGIVSVRILTFSAHPMVMLRIGNNENWVWGRQPAKPGLPEVVVRAVCDCHVAVISEALEAGDANMHRERDVLVWELKTIKYSDIVLP